MGCDIHMHVEVRGADGRWKPHPGPEWEGEWYGGRNYELFALLADVRNRHDITPFAPPRGLPDDISDGLAARYAADNDVWYTHGTSWLSLPELLTFDWDGTPKLWTLVKDRDERWPDGGRAKRVQEYADEQHQLPNWAYPTCMGVSGSGAEDYHRVEWEQSHRVSAGDEIAWVMQRMAALSLTHGAGDLHNVRLVFWFDN